MPRTDSRSDLMALAGIARAFLAHFNPCNLAEDVSQQWQALEHECERAERLTASQPDREAIRLACVEAASLNMTVEAAHRQADRITDRILSLLSGAGTKSDGGVEVTDIDANNAEADRQTAADVLNWLKVRGLYDPRDYEVEGPDVADLLTEHEANLQTAAHGDGNCGCTERCKDRDNCQYDVKPSDPSPGPDTPIADSSEGGRGGVAQKGWAILNQVSAIIHHLNGQAYSSTLSALNDFHAALLAEGAVTETENLIRLSASELACYRWPEDTAEHRAMRAAFVDGAAHTAAVAETDADAQRDDGLVSGGEA